MKKLLLLVICVLIAVVMAGCGGAKKEEPAGEKVLRVATDANFPPFEYYLKDSKVHTGFDIELMKAVARGMGYDKVEFINVEFKNILPGLARKKYDAAIAGITVTRDRQRIADFSDSYMESGLRVVIPVKAEAAEGAGIMKGKKVAAEAGSYGVEAARRVNAAEVVEVENTEAAIKMVAAGIADCAIADSAPAAFFLANGYGDEVKFAGEELAVDNLAVAFAKGNRELLDKFNASLHEVRRSGIYKKIYASYFGNIN